MSCFNSWKLLASQRCVILFSAVVGNLAPGLAPTRARWVLYSGLRGLPYPLLSLCCQLPPAQATSIVSLSLCCGKQHGLRCGTGGSLNSKTALTLNLKVFVLIKSRHIQDNKCIYKYLLLYSVSFFLSFSFLLKAKRNFWREWVKINFLPTGNHPFHRGLCVEFCSFSADGTQQCPLGKYLGPTQ